MIIVRRWVVSAALLALVESCAHHAAEQPPSSTGKTLILVPNADAAPAQGPAWGAPVADHNTESTVDALLQTLATSDPAAGAFFEAPLIVGPALWSGLVAVQPALASIGTKSTAMIPSGAEFITMEARSFFDSEAIDGLRTSTAMQRLAHAMVVGGATIRPATEREREVFYSLIPFEIAGKPVTIVDLKSNRLVVMIEQGKVTWLDMLSMYKTK